MTRRSSPEGRLRRYAPLAALWLLLGAAGSDSCATCALEAALGPDPANHPRAVGAASMLRGLGRDASLGLNQRGGGTP